jgi:hypothetical protein
MGVGNPIWNTFLLETSSQSPRILYYSKNLGKGDLTDLWSDRLIATLITIAPELHFEQ